MNQASSPAPDYLEQYALHSAPFENRPDRKYFYGGAALMQRLDLLAHLTQFGEPLVLIIGPQGSGKTVMLDQFTNRANSRWTLCRLQPESVADLPAHLSRALGGSASGADIDQLLERWDTETDASQLFVIAVDDAQRLDADACRTLCALLERPQGERVRLLLFGTPAVQPLIKENLAKLASTRTPQILEVPRLSEEETAAYLMYRLAVAGYSGESPFSTTEIRGICKAADGWPGGISQFADQTLREHMIRTRSRHVTPDTAARGRKPIWLALAALLVVALVYLGWQSLLGPEEPDADQVAVNETRLALPEPQPALTPETPETPAPATLDREAIPETATDTAATDLEDTAAAPATAAPELPAPLAEAVPLPLPDQDQPPPAEPTAPTAAATDAPPAAAAVETPATMPIQPTPEPAAATAPATETAPVVEAVAEAPAPAVAPAAPAAPAPPTASKSTGGPHREAWLLQQPGESYSLQLLGSRIEKPVVDFIRQHKLDPAQTAYYRGVHKGADWYVLMYGVYPSRGAALKGLAQLPAAVREAKPWPRELQAVQQSIRETKP